MSESLGDGSNTARELRQFTQVANHPRRDLADSGVQRSPRQIESQQYPQLQDAPVEEEEVWGGEVLIHIQVLVDIAPALESSSSTAMKPPPAVVGGILGSTWTVRPIHRSTVSTPASEADNPPEPVQ